MSRSSLCWVGGKFYSAERILLSFPLEASYSTYVEVFGGAAHVLFRKPQWKHLEVYNDLNGDLVNFWMICRNRPQEFQRLVESLPYARQLYEEWRDSLFDGSQLSDMERAVRWFYVLRSSVGGIIRSTRGSWGYDVRIGKIAQSFYNTAQLFADVASRFRGVQIEHQDFEKVIRTYGRHSTTLLYCDPPYVGFESYYRGIPPFTREDHERLACLLNATPAQVALSYYPCKDVDDWYPPDKWRRVSWQTYKHAERTDAARQVVTELLLLNYPEVQMSLWQE